MKIFNTLTKKKEIFKSLEAGKIGMYLCGPTVYDKGHLGHARSAVAFDVIRKYFRYRGFSVKFVSNFTDIDDKMIKRAAERGITVPALADSIIPLYERDYGRLGIEKPDVSPKATEFMPKMKELIEVLLAKKIAYRTSDGIYFSVRKFKGYGKLSHQNLDELLAGARVDINEEKQAPEDFALWKKEKPGEPSWDGPLGMRGRPGWHIECSAMSASLLGETFDIHAGGQDLIFPHHEDEIAQSEAVSGKQFARYWMHNGFIRVNDEKMSKSLGNFFTIEDVLKQYDPAVVRYFLLSTHYRMPIDFSDPLLESAKASLMRLRDFVRAVSRKHEIQRDVEKKKSSIAKSAKAAFEKAMDNDFEISDALGALFEFVKEMNVRMAGRALTAAEVLEITNFLRGIDSFLGVLFEEESGLDRDIEKMIEFRNEARAKRDFTRADEIRKQLKAKGIELEDTSEGTVWKRSL